MLERVRAAPAAMPAAARGAPAARPPLKCVFLESTHKNPLVSDANLSLQSQIQSDHTSLDICDRVGRNSLLAQQC